MPYSYFTRGEALYRPVGSTLLAYMSQAKARAVVLIPLSSTVTRVEQ